MQCIMKLYPDASPQKRHCVFDELPWVGFERMSLPFFGGPIQGPAEHDCNGSKFALISFIMVEKHIIYYDFNLIPYDSCNGIFISPVASARQALLEIGDCVEDVSNHATFLNAVFTRLPPEVYHEHFE